MEKPLLKNVSGLQPSRQPLLDLTTYQGHKDHISTPKSNDQRQDAGEVE
jgi:hypothetical protein